LLYLAARIKKTQNGHDVFTICVRLGFLLS